MEQHTRLLEVERKFNVYMQSQKIVECKTEEFEMVREQKKKYNEGSKQDLDSLESIVKGNIATYETDMEKRRLVQNRLLKIKQDLVQSDYAVKMKWKEVKAASEMEAKHGAELQHELSELFKFREIRNKQQGLSSSQKYYRSLLDSLLVLDLQKYLSVLKKLQAKAT